MTELYHGVGIEIRPDLVEAHMATVKEWARPGNHWSAAERLALVGEVRAARARQASGDGLPPWVAPSAVEGLMAEDHPLPAAAVDAVWRLTNHSGTLTESWYREIVAGGLTPEQYVELVAVVATANCLDVFATTVGLDPLPLPAPAEGRPDGDGGEDAVVSTHWVPTVPGRGPNVTKALTAVPVAVAAWQRLSAAQYVDRKALTGDLQWSRGALDRPQVELLAATTSLLNECFY